MAGRPATGDDLAARLAALVRVVPDHPRPGIMFRDITTLLGDRVAFGETVRGLAAPYVDEGIAAVAGVEARGFILGAAVAYALGAAFVPLRKEGHLPARTLSAEYSLEYGAAVLEVHADALARGQRVLIVDDLLATGGTAAAAVKLVEAVGGVVAGLAFLIELAGLDGSAALGGHPHTSLIMV